MVGCVVSCEQGTGVQESEKVVQWGLWVLVPGLGATIRKLCGSSCKKAESHGNGV